MRVTVVPYRPEWAEDYQKEAAQIKTILGEELLAIHHIGSTSVPGLTAKPIIDILSVVWDIDRIDPYNSQFAAFGYECCGEFGIPGRRYFRKGADERTKFTSLRKLTCGTSRHLAVRNYLRVHPAEAATYGALKQELASRFPADIDAYCDGKDAFVKALEQRALRWTQKQHG